MHASYYAAFPARFHPEFAGLAARYSQRKERRKTEQLQKQSLESSRMHAAHLEQQLQSTIYSKSLELTRLQSSRARKLEDAQQVPLLPPRKRK
jgi:hypothetical protein